MANDNLKAKLAEYEAAYAKTVRKYLHVKTYQNNRYTHRLI